MVKEIKLRERTFKLDDKEVNYKLGKSSVLEECTPWRAPRVETHYEVVEVETANSYGWVNRKTKFAIFRDYVDGRVKFSLYFSVEDYVKGAPPIIDCGTKKECLHAAVKVSRNDVTYYTRVSCLVSKHNEAEKYKELYKQAHAALKTIKEISKHDSGCKAAETVVDATGLVGDNC